MNKIYYTILDDFKYTFDKIYDGFDYGIMFVFKLNYMVLKLYLKWINNKYSWRKFLEIHID